MASASLSAVAGAILLPTLPQIALDKLINYLCDYLSRDHPSSSGEAAKLQQLQKEREALEDANQKLKTMQSEAKELLKKDKQNKRVVHLLKKLNDFWYEIQDLESDMEYMELQRKVEERDQAEAEKSKSKGRKLWFPFSWAKGQPNEKKRRLSSSESLKLPLDDYMVNRISSLIEKINSMNPDKNVFNGISSNQINDPKNHLFQNKRVTTSFTNERKIYGRDSQTENLIRVLLEMPNVNANISVVPILGMGGIGKTTLAQFAFNNPEIEKCFDKKVWVFVSDHFDWFRITREIVESLSTNATSKFPYDTTNLDLLESELKRRLTGEKKFLLVLDDVWSNEWQQLLAPLKHTKVESIKIIVTGRDPTVLAGAAGLETRDRFLLEGLDGDAYTSFFINCVFGNENPPDNYSSALQSIGKQIMEKLKGSPLAVRTVGRLLGDKLTEEHWKNVLDSDLWKTESDAKDIMPALALSYHHLPEHLQLCFAFCSVVPKGHAIHKYELIGMWIAHGYILESATNLKTLEDIGEEYVEELNQLSLIEVVGWDKNLCKMHDLLHDLAQSVSQGEVCIYEGKEGKGISKNVRHLFVHGPVDLKLVVEISNRLRTLVLYGDDLCSQVDLVALERIRVLVVIDRNVKEFPEAVTHLKHLRYLDFNGSSFQCVPNMLCRLYQLRVLRLPQLDASPSLFHSLINLRSFMLFSRDQNNYQVENLFQVRREGSNQIAQLRNMNQLTRQLEILGLENIENKEEARKANLKEKGLVKDLRLCWKDSEGAGCTHGVQEEVFECLQPHGNLKRLQIQGYMGSKSPSWLGTTPALQNLRKIVLQKCRNWSRLPPSFGLLHSLVDLSLSSMENIIIEGDDTAATIFPSLKRLELFKLASVSFKGMSLSSSSSSSSSTTTTQSGDRKLFPLLEELIVYECDVENVLPWPMLSKLLKLHIVDSRGLDAQLPGCLKGLKSLTWLKISGSKCETRLFDREVMATLERLKEVTVESCNELISVDGLQVLPSLTRLWIRHCSKLRLLWVEEGTSEQQQQQQGVVLLPNLSHLRISNCKDLESLPAWLPLLPSLESLAIDRCPKVRSLPEEGTSEQQQRVLLPKLSKLSIIGCKDLESLPAWLPLLPSLKHLMIRNCPKVRSLPEEGTSEQQQGVLLPKLSKIAIECCENLESLPTWLPVLPSLKLLQIWKCPKVRSLTEGGLPSSLRKKLVIQTFYPDLLRELSNPEEQMIQSCSFEERSIFERKRRRS